jgi:hypothetical protein
MGLLLIGSIGAMTSFMTMVQLIALALTTMQTPAVQNQGRSVTNKFKLLKNTDCA